MTIHDDLREVISELNRIIASMGIQEPDEPVPDLTINTKDLPFGATLDIWVQWGMTDLPKGAATVAELLLENLELRLRVNNGGSRD